MDRILFYPHYMPNKRWMRILLLFNEQLTTIVPTDDQEKVLDIDYVAEIHRTEKNLIKFTTISNKVFNDTVNDETKAKLDLLVDRLRSTAGAGEREPPELSVENIHKLKSLSGYRYMSADKLRDLIETRLAGAGLAIEIPPALRDQLQDESMLTEVPVLTHPEVAQFMIARLASTAAEEANIACVTNQSAAYSFNAMRARILPPGGAVDAHLLAQTLDLIVPKNLDRLEVDKFLEIRGTFKPYRDQVQQMLRYKLEKKRPFDLDEFDAYHARICSIAEGVRESAFEVESQIAAARDVDFERAVLRNVIVVSGTGIGAAIAGIVGAVIGAALPLALLPMAERALGLEPIEIRGPEPVRALAELRDSMTSDRDLLPMIVPAFARG